MSKIGFVHGDIHRLNIIFYGNRLNLIDLEPSFKQRRHGKVTFMSSAPKLSINDRRNKTITLETDKIGYYFYCYNLFQKEYFNIPLKEIISKRRNKEWEFLPLKEADFVKLDFISIWGLFAREYKSFSI